MRSKIIAFAIAAASGWALPGCTETPLGTGENPNGPDCTTCHGSKQNPAGEAQAAPPRGLDGETEVFQPAVGAHQAHLADSALRRALSCSDCHPVPAALTTPGHHDGKLDFAWGALATTSDLKPAYDAQTGKCSSVWCHGGALGGGANTTPVWTGGPGQAACGACHGLPPPAPHPADSNCHSCHTGTVGADGKIDLAAGLHINGRFDGKKYHDPGWSDPAVHGPAANGGIAACMGCHGNDLAGGSNAIACTDCHAAGWKTNCTFCHGGTNDPSGAPPLDTHRKSATSEVTVGAHASHLKDSAFGKAVACSECHVVPADVTSAGHLDGPTASLTWGALAKAGSLTPSWDRASAKCSSTWCHGGALTGGTVTEPTWTVLDGTQAKCGTCHGLPPPPPHAASTNCNGCHPATVKPDGTLDLAAGKHLDGVVQGTEPHPAGWVNAHGAEAMKNFASCKPCHGSDLSGGSSGVGCNKCHDGWQTNCTFCHGGKDSQTGAPPVDTHGKSATTEVTVGAHSSHLADSEIRKALACNDCHVVPTDALSAGHVDGPTATLAFGTLAKMLGENPSWDRTAAKCSSVYCHGASLAAWGGTNKMPQWTKVDGTQAACGTCHGAPPPAPHPQNASCNECHAMTVLASGKIDVAGGKHIDGILEVTGAHSAGWAVGSTHGPQAEANISTCQFCHGQDLNGAAPAPSCNQCHNGFRTNCTFCHGGTDNQTGAPPETVAGLTATTERAVGAHSAHVGALSKLAKPIGCNECHAVPTDALTPGHMDNAVTLSFGTIAKSKGATPAFDTASATCSSVYCHGAKMAAPSGTLTTPQWTKVDGTQDACGTCHGKPPTGSFTNASYSGDGGSNTFSHQAGLHLTYRCSACHPGMDANNNLTDPTLHVDGKTDLTTNAKGCGCHH
ncbi:MAG TPA: CxxxxCH/CxxCH domain-containing protein [Myxococcales bacterium]|jgi:predicted CxxxxCH...CXXCH cytochrome family protein